MKLGLLALSPLNFRKSSHKSFKSRGEQGVAGYVEVMDGLLLEGLDWIGGDWDGESALGNVVMVLVTTYVYCSARESPVEIKLKYRPKLWYYSALTGGAIVEDSETQAQLQAFHRFALGRLDNGGRGLSLDELYDEWRVHNPTDSELRENSRAIAASISDLEQGECGTPASDFVKDFKSRNGFN